MNFETYFEINFEDKNVKFETDFKNKNVKSINFIVEVKKQKTNFENKNFEAIVVKSKSLTIEINLLKKFESICNLKIN